MSALGTGKICWRNWALDLFSLASGELGGGKRECYFCIPCNVAATLSETAVASFCPFTAGIHKINTIFEKKQQSDSNSAAQGIS